MNLFLNITLRQLLCVYSYQLPIDTLVSINVVTLPQPRLMPRWETVFVRVDHFGAEPSIQSTQPEPSLCE